MTSIFHIADADEWDMAARSDHYTHESLTDEGFIHLSSRDQVVATTSRYYSGVEGLVLLEVDPSGVNDQLRWEESIGGELFPHLYAPLPTRCVIAVHQWDESAQRTFD